VIKSELVERLSVQNPRLYRRDCEKIVSTIFAEITAAMARGDRVELRGFGSFFAKFREARTGKNPRTGRWFWSDERPFLSLGPERR
jgi:integration host factor subunit beta